VREGSGQVPVLWWWFSRCSDSRDLRRPEALRRPESELSRECGGMQENQHEQESELP